MYLKSTLSPPGSSFFTIFDVLERFQKIRRPSACQNIHWGRFTSPYPLRPGHLAARVCHQFVHSDSFVKMGAKFSSNPKILPRGVVQAHFGSIFGHLKLKRIGCKLLGVPREGGSFLHGKASPLDVQRALCTVKPALLDVQRTLCTAAPRWECQSLYNILDPGPSNHPF